MPLKVNGKARPKAQSRMAMETMPARGMIQLDPCRHLQRWEDKQTPKIAQLIAAGTATTVIRGLLYAEVGVMRNWQFVVRGKEDRGDDRDPVRAGPDQIWWCRVVTDHRRDAGQQLQQLDLAAGGDGRAPGADLQLHAGTSGTSTS